jgi:hypothetical protein
MGAAFSSRPGPAAAGSIIRAKPAAVNGGASNSLIGRRVMSGSHAEAGAASWPDRLAARSNRRERGPRFTAEAADDNVQSGPGLSSPALGWGVRSVQCARKSLCGRTTAPQRKSVGDRDIGGASDPEQVSKSCLPPSPASQASSASAASIRRSSTPSGRGERAPTRKASLILKRRLRPSV